MVPTPEEAVIKIRLDPELKKKIDDLLSRKQITQVAAMNSLLEWLVVQDDLLQSMILGQLDDDADLLTLALRRRLALKQKGKA